MASPRAVVLFAFLLAGCSAQFGPADVPAPPDQGPGRVMECTEPLAYAGRSSLAALGLADLSGPDANRIGMVWITEGAAPVICIEWPDGSGMVTILDAPFRPPGAEPGEDRAQAVSPSALVTLLAVAGALAVAIVVSYLAFRRDRPPAA